MKEETRNLLLADLSGRVPYGVKIQVTIKDVVCQTDVYSVFNDGGVYVEDDNFIDAVDIAEVKPYLFPLSSMTEKQEEELKAILGNTPFFDNKNEVFYDMNGCSKIYLSDVQTAIDWFNKNHFDYRGLIEKGLALDATNLNVY